MQPCMYDFSSLKIFWVICSLFRILPWSSKLTSMSFHLASFSLPEEKNHDTVLQKWFGFHQWDNIIIQLCLTPISSYARKQHADQYTGTPGHLCLAITFHLYWAPSCWWITVTMEKIIQDRGRQQHLAILWQAQIFFPGLLLWSDVKSWMWLRDWRLLPGDLQISVQDSFYQAAAAQPCRSCRQDPVCLCTVLSLRQPCSSHFMHSLILSIMGRGTYSKKTWSKMIKVA